MDPSVRKAISKLASSVTKRTLQHLASSHFVKAPQTGSTAPAPQPKLLPLIKLYLLLSQACFSTIQFGEYVVTMHQDAENMRKKLKKARVDLQVALEANSALEAKLHVAHAIKERKDAKKKELTKKLLTSEDAYLKLIERYSLLLTEKEKLEKDVNTLKSNVEIMHDAVKEIMPDFYFKRLNEIAAVEATCHAQFTTSEEGDEGLEDLIVPTAPSSVPIVVQ